MRIAILTLTVAMMLGMPATADDMGGGSVRVGGDDSFGHKLLFYIPNRLLDAMDIVRARGRFGPGFAGTIRASDAAETVEGSYQSFYLGLPGPRGRQQPKLPIGWEMQPGGSPGDEIAPGKGVGPDYAPDEMAIGVHIGLVGVELGFSPMELGDFIAGFFFVDLVGDDY
jgi:hypothetical protein